MIKLKNKRADASGDFLLILFRLIMAGIVAVGIILLTGILYAKQFDVRPVEANQLSEKAISCLNSDYSNFNKDYLSKCLTPDRNEEYVNLTIIDSSRKQESVYLGERTMEETCKIAGKFRTKPWCQKSIYYVFLKKVDSNEQVTLKVLVGIGKAEKNVI
ncbi:hypothetical protein HZA33_01635 [Candidatus Pacearchaeota archaeon]|nr:hypothetical protein [Candidatus Pacearchaeota archaeon]